MSLTDPPPPTHSAAANHLFDALRRRASTPDAMALYPVQGAVAWRYGDLDRASARIAHALRTRGVRPGDRVAAQIEKSPDGLALYLATVRAGAVFLPLNTAYTAGEISYFLRDADPRVMVCDPAHAAALADVARDAGVMVLETLGADGTGTLSALAAGQDDAFVPVPRASDDLAAILYTSGTTGRSKGAMLTHDNLVSNAECLVAAWRFTAADRLLHALPVYHTHGLFTATNTVLFAGAGMLFLPRFEPDAVLRALPDATAMMGVPTFYTRLLDHAGLSREATRTVRLFTSGSAPLLAETHRAWYARTGHAILERYGMTETNMMTSNPYDGERRPGTVGFPLPGIALRVVDMESGAPTTPGDIGVLEVRGPNVFRGYWRNPEKTAAEFRADGFFVTGDLGRVDAEGYVHIVGRGKDLIISGGFNVYPKEVELEIDAIAGVRESAVIGLPHRHFGEGVAAVVVAEPDARIEEGDILAALEGRLAKFKRPKRVYLVAELPRNAMGKVQKKTLRDEYRAAFQES